MFHTKPCFSKQEADADALGAAAAADVADDHGQEDDDGDEVLVVMTLAYPRSKLVPQNGTND